MIKYAYIACSYQKRNEYQDLIDSVETALKQHGWDVAVPVFDLSHVPADDYAQVMTESFNKLKHASLLIAEASGKNIGIGIEIGYAKGLGIPVIYLRKKDASFSTTVAGTVDYAISYATVTEAVTKINEIISSLSPKESDQ